MPVARQSGPGTNGRLFTIGAVGALLALGYGALCFAIGPAAAGRLLRNPFCSKELMPLPPVHESCSPELLTRRVTIVVTVKDTCSQATLLLTHLAAIVPRTVPIIYIYPEFVGCLEVDPSIGSSLFEEFIVLKIPAAAAPIQGFLDAQAYVNTPYALLMHNDAYPMESQAVCELLRALEAHPEAAFAAPQLYERSENGIAVPHGHHRNLHVRPSPTDVDALSIDFNRYLGLRIGEICSSD